MLKAIIVDDNADDREGMLDFIPWEELGFQVVGCAENGRKGYELALSAKPDLILTDIFMPEIDGIILTSKVKEYLPEVHVIFMSCFDEFEYAKNAMKYNVSSYLLKPIILDDAIEAVNKVRNECIEAQNKLQKEKRQTEQLEKSLPLLREKFFSNLLFGYSFGEGGPEAQAELLGISTDIPYRTALLFLYSADLSQHPEIAYSNMNTLENIYEDIFIEPYNAYAVNYAMCEVMLLVSEESMSFEEFMEKLFSVQQLFEDETDCILSICVGKKVFIQGIAPEFKRCRDSFMSSGMSGESNIVSADELEDVLDGQHNYNFEDVYSDVLKLFEERFETIDMFVAKYYKNVSQYRESYIKSQSLYILNVVNILLLERNMSLENIFEDYTVVWNKISRYTIANIRIWMTNMLKAVKEYLFSEEENSFTDIVEAIKKNIDENFPALQSLEQVVAPLYISVGYASRIFKKYTNESIYDYLLKTKMEEAKRLLKNKRLKAYEIGEKLGYSSNTYFTTSFKKYTGMTPKEYRYKLH